MQNFRSALKMRLQALYLLLPLLVSTSLTGQTAPINHFTPQEISTGSCWIDAKTGVNVPTGPWGWNPIGASSPTGRFSNPDEKHVSDTQAGKTFVNDPSQGWIDAATGNPVPTGPWGWNPNGASSPTGRFSNPDEKHVSDGQTGRTFVRVPCPPQPPPPVRTPTFSGLHTTIGVSTGAIGRTDTYDDGYKAGGTSLYADVSIGMVYPVAHTLFVGGNLNLLFPFQTATVTTTQTKLDTAATFEAIVGGNTKAGHLPISIWGGFGGAVGAVRSGYTSSTLTYSDVEALPGITVSAGASTPVAPHVRATAEIRYIDLFSGTFHSPTGTYSMKDSGIGGSVGVQWTFGK